MRRMNVVKPIDMITYMIYEIKKNMNGTHGGHHVGKYLLWIYPFASFAKYICRVYVINPHPKCLHHYRVHFRAEKTVSIINQFVAARLRVAMKCIYCAHYDGLPE